MGDTSGRLTAPLCIAGGICLQLLAREGVTIAAHIQAIGDQEDLPFDPVAVGEAELQTLFGPALPCPPGVGRGRHDSDHFRGQGGGGLRGWRH